MQFSAADLSVVTACGEQSRDDRLHRRPESGAYKPQRGQDQAHAAPSAPLSGLRANRPPIFKCPMVRSMALRLLIMALSVRVMPRLWPDIRMRTPSACTPR